MKKANNRKKMTKPKIIVISAIILLAVSALTFFGIRFVYNQGVHDGYLKYETETSDFLVTLGNAISEKAEFIKNSGTVLNDVPTEIDGDSVDVYINNLTKLQESVHTETVKTAIGDYIEKWQNFKTVYASKNNDEITSNFNELKASATNLAQQIREVYDLQITTAVKKLGAAH